MVDEKDKRDAGEVAKLVAIVFLVAISLVFAAVNSDKVTVDLLLFDVTSRLFIVLIGTTIVGVVIGFLLAKLRDRR